MFGGDLSCCTSLDMLKLVSEVINDVHVSIHPRGNLMMFLQLDRKVAKLSEKAKYPIGCFGENYVDSVVNNWITWVCFKNYLVILTWHVRHYMVIATRTSIEWKSIMDHMTFWLRNDGTRIKESKARGKASKSHLITKHISREKYACFRCNRIFETFFWLYCIIKIMD